jgi:general secretion pathway protein D
MDWRRSILVVLALTAAGFCSDGSTNPPSSPPAENVAVLPCGEGTSAAPGCNPSKKEVKEAKSAFAKALRLEKNQHSAEAFEAFQAAARLEPRNVSYVTARELCRQQLVFDALQRGNSSLLGGRQMEALADFRNAEQLDPSNEFARERERDALGDALPKTATEPRLLEASAQLRVTPNPVRADFHYRGDGRSLLTAVAEAFGMTASFDDSVVARPVRFDITDVDFYTAMSAAGEVTHTFWTPLQAKQILLAEESQENHRKFDRMAMRTFFLPGMTAPADMNNLVTVLRNLFDIKVVAAQPASGTITLRAPDNLLDSATQFIENLETSRPEVMLDVRVYVISYMLTRNLGLQIPDNFQLFNIPAAALLALAGTNVQSLINQLISSGGINQANSTAISALLAQLEGQGQQNSIFSQPVATFGNGQTLEGVSLGTLGVQASQTQSWVRTLEHSTLRVSQGSDASFRVGSRYPILNASFAPIFNSPAIAQVIGNNSFQAPFPSFSYEDLGVNLKTKTLVNGDSAISMQVDLQLRTLLGQSMNGIPVIANREFQGSLTLEDGQPAVVAGEVDHTEQRSINGVPGLGAIPGLSQILDSNNLEDTTDELLIVITPRVIGATERKQAVVWMTN